MDLRAQAPLSPLDHALNRATSQVSVQSSDLSWENPHSLEPGPLRLWSLTHRSHLDPHFNPSERTWISGKLYAFCLSADFNRWTTKKMTFLPKAPPFPPLLEQYYVTLRRKLSCNRMCVFSYTCVYIHAPHRCVVPLNSSRGCQIRWNWSHIQLWTSVWMLGTEHWHPARTTSAFDPWETSPDPTLASFPHSRETEMWFTSYPPLLQPPFLRLIFPSLIFVLQGFA